MNHDISIEVRGVQVRRSPLGVSESPFYLVLGSDEVQVTGVREGSVFYATPTWEVDRELIIEFLVLRSGRTHRVISFEARMLPGDKMTLSGSFSMMFHSGPGPARRESEAERSAAGQRLVLPT